MLVPSSNAIRYSGSVPRLYTDRIRVAEPSSANSKSPGFRSPQRREPVGVSIIKSTGCAFPGPAQAFIAMRGECGNCSRASSCHASGSTLNNSRTIVAGCWRHVAMRSAISRIMRLVYFNPHLAHPSHAGSARLIPGQIVIRRSRFGHSTHWGVVRNCAWIIIVIDHP